MPDPDQTSIGCDELKRKMKTLVQNRRLITTIGILVFGIMAAPLIWLVIQTLIIDPIAYYWWAIKGVVKSIPQLNYWIFIVGSSGIISLIALFRWQSRDKEQKLKNIIKESPIQTLANLISRSQTSYYYKWLIANRLAIITLEINNVEIGTHSDDQQGYSAIKQNLPESVCHYLEAGLDKTHMSFRPRKFFHKSLNKSPLDKDINQVLSFIESQLESTS